MNEKMKAKVCVQGVGSLLVHEDGDQLLGLFPHQRHYHDFRGHSDLPTELCNHFAMVQVKTEHLFNGVQKGAPLTTFHLDGVWVGLDIDGEVPPMTFQGGDGRVPGIPQVEDLFPSRSEVPPFRDDLIPKDHDRPSKALTTRVAAGLYLDAGTVRPHKDFRHRSRLARFSRAGAVANGPPGQAASGSQTFSTVVEVDLGQEITNLGLLFRPIQGGETTRIPLRATDEPIEIWVRHFCDVSPAVPCPKVFTPGDEIDLDFLLNYLLLDLPQDFDLTELVVPVVDMDATNEFIGANGIRGIDCVQCQCKGGSGGNFAAQFTRNETTRGDS